MNKWSELDRLDKVKLEAIQILLCHHSKLFLFLFDPLNYCLNTSPDVLLEKATCFSSGEYILIQMALDIWSSSGYAHIYELLLHLDYKNFCRAIEAFHLLRTYQHTQFILPPIKMI